MIMKKMESTMGGMDGDKAPEEMAGNVTAFEVSVKEYRNVW